MNTTYDPALYPRFFVTTDIVVFAVREQRLQALLIRRGEAPFAGWWALPGGFVRPDETLDGAAARELTEETGVGDIFLEQFGAFGDPGRDPRETSGTEPVRIVSVAYTALLPSDLSERIVLKAGTDAADAQWSALDGGGGPLAFDHDHILARAVQHLRGRLETEPRLAVSLLPRRFTLTELQEVFEALRGASEDKRNFRKWAVATGWLTPTNEQRRGTHRPAQLFEFTPPEK